MSKISAIILLTVAAEHFFIVWLEGFHWASEQARTVSNLSRDVAEKTVNLGKNMALYNGFLAAGLVLSTAVGDLTLARFISTCVLLAGVFGGFWFNRRIWWVQALPGAIALASTFWS